MRVVIVAPPTRLRRRRDTRVLHTNHDYADASMAAGEPSGDAMATAAALTAASSSWESSLFDSEHEPGVGDDRGLFFRPLCRGAGWFFTACSSGVTSPRGAQRGTAKPWGPSPPKRLVCLTHFRALNGMPALTKSTIGVCGWSVGEYRDCRRAETRPSLRGVASTCLRRRLEPAIVFL